MMHDTSHMFESSREDHLLSADDMYLKECYNPDPWLLAQDPTSIGKHIREVGDAIINELVYHNRQLWIGEEPTWMTGLPNCRLALPGLFAYMARKVAKEMPGYVFVATPVTTEAQQATDNYVIRINDIALQIVAIDA